MLRSEVRANRQKWIDFLMVEGRKKANGVLDNGNGERCCLGHACFILGETREKSNTGNGAFSYGINDEEFTATSKVIEMLGLWSNAGASESSVKLQVFKDNKLNRENLAAINDDTTAGPNRIGKYLQSVIEGGPDTPWCSLEGYPETLETV